MKRAFDIVLSAMGLLVLSVPGLFIAARIVWEDGLPVFFTQERVGKDGKRFKLFKFRTMYRNAERQGQITVGSRDPRITPSGFWLRKYKLDEFPQLLNVLKGEMSLVGPRPEVPRYVQLYSDEQRRVLTIKPGITDWASIAFRDENTLLASAEDPEAFYANTILPQKITLNLVYIQNQSIRHYFKILLATAFQIFK